MAEISQRDTGYWATPTVGHRKISLWTEKLLKCILLSNPFISVPKLNKKKQKYWEMYLHVQFSITFKRCQPLLLPSYTHALTMPKMQRQCIFCKNCKKIGPLKTGKMLSSLMSQYAWSGSRITILWFWTDPRTLSPYLNNCSIKNWQVVSNASLLMCTGSFSSLHSVLQAQH